MPDESYMGISLEGLRRIYGLLYDLATSDGQLDETERDVLDSYRRRFQIGVKEARFIERGIDEGILPDDAKSQPELDMARKALFQMAAADSHLAAEEEERLIDIARKSGFGILDVQRKLRWRGLSLSEKTLARAGEHDDGTSTCPTCGQALPAAGEKGDAGDAADAPAADDDAPKATRTLEDDAKG